MQRAVVRVVDDGADVIGREAQHDDGSHRVRIDAVDDRSAVRPVLGDRDPDVGAVVIKSARVVDGALAEREVGETAAGCSPS